MPSIRETLNDGAARLSGPPEIDARREAELLLIEATGLSRTTLVAWPDREVAPNQVRAFFELVERRHRGEPIAYIRGRQAFWDLELQTTTDTLIPRPETELLVELALERLPANGRLIVADLGTGSGAIAAALARERPKWTLIAAERSAAAITIAAANLRRLGLTNAHPLYCDWLDSLTKDTLDAVVSNPPYVRDDDHHLNAGDVRFEPKSALAAGADGLDAIRRIAADAKTNLRLRGLLLLEHGYDQGVEVRSILAAEGYLDIETYHDLAGLERVTAGTRGN